MMSSHTGNIGLSSIDVIFSDTSELYSSLIPVKSVGKDTCELRFEERGLTVESIDGSKCIQVGVFFGSKLFQRYHVPQEMDVSVQVQTLLETLKIFMASDVGPVSISYPGPQSELVLRSTISNAEGAGQEQDPAVDATLPMCYAMVETMEPPIQKIQMSDYFSDPVASCMAVGSLFREAIEDMDYAGKMVGVEMKRDVQQLTVSSQSTDIEIYVDIPRHKMLEFSCVDEIVETKYNKNFFKTAMTVMARSHAEATGAEPHLCKIAIDPEGMMKVTHLCMFVLDTNNDDDQGDHGSSNTQGLGGARESMVVTQFFLLPMAEVDEEPASSHAL